MYVTGPNVIKEVTGEEITSHARQVARRIDHEHQRDVVSIAKVAGK